MVGTIFVFTSFFISLSVLRFLPRGSFKLRLINRIQSLHSKLLLKVFNIKVKLVGEFPKGNFLLVSNHLSYLDIPVLSSLVRTMFVTSDEMASSPGFGAFIRYSDCLLVDRKRYTTLLYDLKEMSILLDLGHVITLFPEATTSSGNILPFKPTLMSSATHANVPIVAVAIRYLGLDNNTKDTVFYYGTMEMLPHLTQRIKNKQQLLVEVEVCSVINSQTFKDRKALASFAHQTISSKTLKY